jgi:hypothetical protein
MAEVTKIAGPSLTSVTPPSSNQMTGGDSGVLVAGENIAAFDNVYLKVDGTVWRATGAAVAAAANVAGQASKAFTAGARNVTLYFGDINVVYGTGLVPGTRYYLSGVNPGGLADAASTGGTVPIAMALDTQRVRFFGPR